MSLGSVQEGLEGKKFSGALPPPNLIRPDTSELDQLRRNVDPKLAAGSESAAGQECLALPLQGSAEPGPGLEFILCQLPPVEAARPLRDPSLTCGSLGGRGTLCR